MNTLKNIHKTADVKSHQIGEYTRIWQYVVVLPDAKIGDNVNISSHCFIANNVVIGNRVTVQMLKNHSIKVRAS